MPGLHGQVQKLKEEALSWHAFWKAYTTELSDILITRCTRGVRVVFSEQECELIVVLIWINQTFDYWHNCVVYKMAVFEIVVHRNVDNWIQLLTIHVCILAQTTHREIVGKYWQFIHIRNCMISINASSMQHDWTMMCCKFIVNKVTFKLKEWLTKWYVILYKDWQHS